MAAKRKVCVFSGMNLPRSGRAGVSWRSFLLLALLACFSPALIHASGARLAEKTPAEHEHYLFHANLDLNSFAEKMDEFPPEQAAGAQATGNFVIDRIEFTGNRRIRTDTLKARIFSRDGDPYNEETLRRDFQALWNTQFFEDVKLRVEDSPTRPNGKVIVFEVTERPVIRRIRYDGIHSISESDILDRFKDKKVGLTVESQFDPTRIKKAEVVLKDLLGEHGRQFAKVTPQYERIASSNAVILVFKIEEGPKVKVGQIQFTGNHAFSRRKLIRAMHNDRPYSIPLKITEISVMSKTYDHDKLIEDIEVGIRGIYQDNGYFKVLVKDPILENIDTNGWRWGVPVVMGRSSGKAVNITIPIEEGQKYTMGTLRIASSDPDKALSLKVEALKGAFPLKQGDVFSTAKIRKALEDYTKIYGQYGFIDFVPTPETDIDEAAKKIDVTMKFDEGKQYYVRRIDFSGNTTTRDKVIRRQLLIDEGQLFNKRAWELSVLRINQLDYFDKLDPDKAVEIKRNQKQGTVDLLLKLKEKGKQSIGLQGGVSGLAGGFIGLTYQTNNFLGLGETLTLSAQIGQYQRNLMFGFTEPYLFDRPISSGFTIFSTLYKFDQAQQAAELTGQQVSINPQFIQDYNQNSTGFTTFANYALKKHVFTRVGITYGLTRTNISTYNQSSQLLFTQLQYGSLAGPSALNGIIASTVTGTISYNTIDNPINATRGKSYFYSLSFTGGPIGGNVNTITNTGEFKYFHPINHRRNAVGVRFLGGFTTGYGGKEIPPYSRFYLGGENDLRGFDIRAVSPVTYIPNSVSETISVSGRALNVPVLLKSITFPGGDTQGVMNLEYRIPIAGPVAMSLFNDIGTVGVLRKGGLLLSSTGIDNINQMFPLANQQAQLQLAPGTNFKLRDSAGIEFIVNLPIVQAPFRIYYSYNPLRIHQTLYAPNAQINGRNLALQCQASGMTNPLFPFDPNSWQTSCSPAVVTAIQPIFAPSGLNYFEPKTTFRFTVSRTF
ncbi:MAG TPA: outer membrane protein assembly factor BamA [Candidatus Acidoferrum sp.]|nr:outer membrane protein assembly factor BamA [Candidatus Acidoferrum sp.]